MTQKKVLIVEDDPIIMLSLEFLITQKGYQALQAATGEQALELAQSELPNLIMMDIMLPKLTGFEVCEALRAQPQFKKTKIILLTAKGRELDIEKGIQLGADAYVTKPFSTRELTQIVQDLLQG